MKTFLIVQFCLTAISLLANSVALAIGDFSTPQKPDSRGSKVIALWVNIALLLWCAHLLRGIYLAGGAS